MCNKPEIEEGPMHYWGSQWFIENGEDLRDAELFIQKYIEEHSDYYLCSKEKWGCLVYEHLIPKDFRTRPEKGWDTPRAARVLKQAIKKAIKKWPHLADELLDDDWE